MRPGLGCTFLEVDIELRHTTARYGSTLADRETFLLEIDMHDAHALARQVLPICVKH